MALRISLFFWACQAMFLTGIVGGQESDSLETQPPPMGVDSNLNTQVKLPIIQSVNFELTDTSHPNQKTLIQIARQVTGPAKNIPLSENWIKQTVNNLELSGRFSEIHLESNPEGSGLEVLIKLTPYAFIKNIVFENNYPLFVQELENVMTLKAGSGFSRARVEEQKELLNNLFKREGVKLKNIQTEIMQPTKYSDVTVTFSFEREFWFSWGDFKFEGNTEFSNFKLNYHFKGLRYLNPLPHRQRFRVKEYNSNLKLLKEKYIEKGYYDISIRDSVVYDSIAHKVNVSLDINEGYRYDIEWRGNNQYRGFWKGLWYIWADTPLEKQLDFTAGNKRNIGIKKSINNLEELYKNQGYKEVKIAYQNSVSKKGPPMQKVVFQIKEGPVYRIKEIKTLGNQRMKKVEIEKQILSEEHKGFNLTVFAEDVASIHALYIQKGFYKTKIDTSIQIEMKETGPAVFLTLNIKEGQKRIVKGVRILENPHISEKLFLKTLSTKVGGPYILGSQREDKININALLSELGYPHAEIEIQPEFDSDSTGVTLTYKINEGPQVTMGNVYYAGNFKTKPSVLHREINMDKGEPLSLIKILEAQQQISNLPLFNSVQFKPIGLREKFDTVTIHLNLEEKPNRYFSLRGGYQSDVGVIGGSKVGNINLLGLNKHGWVSGTVNHTTGEFWLRDELGWKTEIGLLEPRLWGSHISASAIVGYQRENEAGNDFYTDIFSTTLGFARSLWKKRLTLGTAFEYEIRDATGTTDSLGFRNNLITRPSITWDTRDSFIRPKGGAFSNYIMEISTSIDGNTNSEINDDFIKHHLVGKRYYSPLSRLTLAVIGRWSMINESSVPDDQKLYLGGTSDVRGYSENSIAPVGGAATDTLGGNLAISWSLESRIDVGFNFELAFFYDAGRLSNVQNPFDGEEYQILNYQKSIGTGIRYITPIGPIGLLYGHKIDPQKYGAWHFTLGYTF